MFTDLTNNEGADQVLGIQDRQERQVGCTAFEFSHEGDQVRKHQLMVQVHQLVMYLHHDLVFTYEGADKVFLWYLLLGGAIIHSGMHAERSYSTYPYPPINAERIAFLVFALC